MKISDYRGEDALDVLVDIIDPMAEIFGDPEFAKTWQHKSRLVAVKYAISKHKKAVVAMLAALERKDPEEYESEIRVFTLPIKALEIFSDPELTNLFPSQGQNSEKTSSGPATGLTQGTDHE